MKQSTNCQNFKGGNMVIDFDKLPESAKKYFNIADYNFDIADKEYYLQRIKEKNSISIILLTELDKELIEKIDHERLQRVRPVETVEELKAKISSKKYDLLDEEERAVSNLIGLLYRVKHWFIDNPYYFRFGVFGDKFNIAVEFNRDYRFKRIKELSEKAEKDDDKQKIELKDQKIESMEQTDQLKTERIKQLEAHNYDLLEEHKKSKNLPTVPKKNKKKPDLQGIFKNWEEVDLLFDKKNSCIKVKKDGRLTTVNQFRNSNNLKAVEMLFLYFTESAYRNKKINKCTISKQISHINKELSKKLGINRKAFIYENGSFKTNCRSIDYCNYKKNDNMLTGADKEFSFMNCYELLEKE